MLKLHASTVNHYTSPLLTTLQLMHSCAPKYSTEYCMTMPIAVVF